MTTKKVSKVRRKKKDMEPPKPVLTPALEERLCTAARITLGLSRNGYKAKYGSDPDEAAKILVANNVDVEELLSRP